MRGHAFSKFIPNELPKGGFEELLKLFLELLNYTSGDANEALDWMNELDKQYKLTSDDYGMGDFIEDLKKKAIWEMMIKIPKVLKSLQKLNKVSDNQRLKRSLGNSKSLEKADITPIFQDLEKRKMQIAENISLATALIRST